MHIIKEIKRLVLCFCSITMHLENVERILEKRDCVSRARIKKMCLVPVPLDWQEQLPTFSQTKRGTILSI